MSEHHAGTIMVVSGPAAMTLRAEDGTPIAEIWLRDGYRENARRLVACWNALQEFTTSEIELCRFIPEGAKP